MLAVDWGSKRIGLAVSDPSGTIARPLEEIAHISREKDAQAVIQTAAARQVKCILVGVTYDQNHSLTPSGRSSARFAEKVRDMTDIPVILWDEHHSTQDAKQAAIQMGISRKKRMGHLDSTAAAMFLQAYLDSQIR